LPQVAKEPDFALKGGTAINLFYRDMPRLSVDVDLTFLPLLDREDSLIRIDEGFERISSHISGSMAGTTTKRTQGGGEGDTRITVSRGGMTVKIETSPVARGVVGKPELKRISEAAEHRFGFAEMNVVSFEDLFAGKIVAALDRQHPRDLFDVMQLYEKEGVSDQLLNTVLVYVASHNRPIHELLDPNLKELHWAYDREFNGMTSEEVPLEDLEATRRMLIEDLRSRLGTPAQKFLLSLHDGEPDFDAIGCQTALELPAVKWKIRNLRILMRDNPEKHRDQRSRVSDLFS
jgi:predicted nucleotidyltransferase component of viral defense system